MSENEDKEIWAAYAEGVDKTGAKKTNKKPDIKKPVQKTTLKKEVIEKIEAKKEEAPQPPPPPPEPKPPVKAQPLDLRIERNMSLGDVVIEGRLDLHGNTEQEAYDTMLGFVQKQSGRGKRMLLVVTGKSGVLCQNVPRWCHVAPFNQYVLAVRSAAKQHGGSGAYYVLLHRQTR